VHGTDLLLTIAHRELREALRNRWLWFMRWASPSWPWPSQLAAPRDTPGWAVLATAASLVNALPLFVR
jgi:hypothetical protein